MGETMKFVFDERKAGQAAAWLLRQHGEPMDAAKLVTLLYLVDRRAFIESGYPLTGDEFVSAQEGPTLRTLRCLAFDDQTPADDEWKLYVKRVGPGQLTHTLADDFGALSERDYKRLGDVLEKHQAMSRDTMLDLSRRLPEWSAPKGDLEAIDPSIMLRTAGFSEDEIRENAELVSSIHWLRTLVRG